MNDDEIVFRAASALSGAMPSKTVVKPKLIEPALSIYANSFVVISATTCGGPSYRPAS
jgi:hypothetical protein